jgi:tetratricopeptide (TPR) repeat protein
VNQEKGIQVSVKEAYGNAVSLLESENYELAEKQLAEILKKYPNDPNCLRLSGVSSIDQGKPEIALIPLQKAIKVAPDFAQAHEDLATAWFLLDELEKSEVCLKNALKIDAKKFSTWKNLGDLLSDQGKEEEANKAYIKALSTDHTYSDLQKAMVSVRKGQIGEAEKIYNQILKDDPNNVNALRLLGLLAISGGSLDQGIMILRKCVQLAPDYALAWKNLANVFRQKADSKSTEESIRCFKKAIELRPNWADGWAGLGTVYTKSSFHNKGIEAYKKSLNIKENQPRVHLSLGHVYKTTGLQDLSVESYKNSIKLYSMFGEAYWSLANLKTYKFSNEEIKLMEEQLSKKDLPEKEKVHFLFALGKAHEDKREYERSINYYHEGNDLNRGRSNYDPKAIEAISNRIIKFFNKDFFKDKKEWGDFTPDPIFIVGLPRSGSTLIEQILSSHSMVEGTMELPFMLNMAKSLGKGSQENTSYPEILTKFTKPETLVLGKEYLSETKYLRSDFPFFTDKMPNNFSHIGLIHLILPNAKIIDARRNPLDTCFSCYKQLFARGQMFTYDLNEIARYYVNYIKLMDHWDRVLPGKVHRVNYEDVVENQEEETRKLLDYCNLPFEEQCLKFYETERAIKTPSSEQVRQPIYKQSVQLWQHYEEYLDQLKLGLSPLKERFNIPD